MEFRRSSQTPLSLSLASLVFYIVDVRINNDLREGIEIVCEVEVLHGERIETLPFSSMKLFTIGFCIFPLNFSCSSNSSHSSSVLMSLKSFNRLVLICYTVE